MRNPSHKKLVNAIIDGEIQAAEIAKRAGELGSSFSARLSLLTRALVKARASGRINAAQAKAAYVEAFKGVSLAAFTQVAQEVLDQTRSATDAIGKEARALGGEVARIDAIRKPDFMERELEKKGGVNGDAETSSPSST